MLIRHAPKVLIVCHSEDVSRLDRSLAEMGFETETLRQRLAEPETTYSSAAKCLLSHMAAWRRVAEIGAPCIVVEADFVPVKNFAVLPGPGRSHPGGCYAWLYASAQRIYRVVSPAFASGQSAAPVAAYVDPEAASKAVDFGIEEIKRHRGAYSAWDTYMRPALKQRGVESLLIPWKSYGEHGGRPNLEHRSAGMTASHRADVLYSGLCFLPIYAGGRRATYRVVRGMARAKALLRLLTGRYIEPARFSDPSLNAWEMREVIRFALSRFVR